MGLRMTEKPANQKSQTQFFPEEEGGASKLLPTEVPFQLSLQSSHSGEVVFLRLFQRSEKHPVQSPSDPLQLVRREGCQWEGSRGPGEAGWL